MKACAEILRARSERAIRISELLAAGRKKRSTKRIQIDLLARIVCAAHTRLPRVV